MTDDRQTAGQPIDPTVLSGLRELHTDGEPDLVTELIDLFLRDTPTQLTALAGAMRADDAQALARTAHRLKGSAANLGATRMSALSAEAETKGRSGSVEGAKPLIMQLHEEFDRVRHVLASDWRRAEQTKGPPTPRRVSADGAGGRPHP